MDLGDYIYRQIAWSEVTFGEGNRTKGLIEHIKKELEEITKEPLDLEEWIDVIILGLDGAWRSGHSPSEIVEMLQKKQDKNKKRNWPKPESQDKPVFHIGE